MFSCSVCNNWCYFCDINGFVCAFCIGVGRDGEEFSELPFCEDAPEFIKKLAQKHDPQ